MADPTITLTKTDLFTNYQALPSARRSQNGVLLVGIAHAYRAANTTTGVGLCGLYTGATALTVAWPGLGAGETVTQSSAAVQLINATVRFYSESVNTPTSVQGTLYSTSVNKITHNSAATIWTGSSYTVSLNAPLVVGDYVRLDNGTGGTVLHTRVAGFEAIAGSMKVLVLEDSLPAALQTGYFNVSVGEVTNLSLTNSQLTTSTSTLTIPSGLTAATARTGTAYAIVGATLPSGAVLGNAYATYSAVYAGNFVNSVQKVYTAADVAGTFPTYQTAESGLGFAAYVGLAPALVGYAAPPILVAAPASETLASYQSIIDLVQFRSDYSTVAVLSDDVTVIAAFKTMVTNRASSGVPTELFIGRDFATDQMIGASTAATIDDSQTSGEDRTVSVSAGAPFATAVSGDTVRHYTSLTEYTTYIVETVISAQAVTLTTEVSGAPLSGQTIQVWHHLSTSEQVNAAIIAAQGYASSTANLLYPNGVTYNGALISSKFMAAYLAALRSYSPPQQLLTFVSPETPWGSASLTAFSGYGAQLAAGGLFTFDTTTDGRLYIKYPRSTDQTTVAAAYEVIVASRQFAERYIYAQLTPYLGLYRSSADLFAELRGTASAAITALVNTNIPGIGPVILGGTIGNIARSSTNANVVVVPITLLLRGMAEDMLQLDVTVTLTTE